MKTRLKMHHMPGDVGIGYMIEMLETRRNKRAKAFAKEVLAKERAVLKERTMQEIEECLELTEDDAVIQQR